MHVGPLAAARELEAMAWLNIRLQMISRRRWNTAFVMVEPPEAALTYGRLTRDTRRSAGARVRTRLRRPERFRQPFTRHASPSDR